MKIDTLESVQLGETTQWIRTHGVDVANPVLLLIQQGPGLPMLNEVRRFERLLGLERDFTVVYWDQRGCGRSLRRHDAGAAISVDLMVADTVSLLELLRLRVGTPSVVCGFSFGAAIGAYSAAQRPDLVSSLVAVGTDVDGRGAAECSYAFAIRTAQQRANKRAIRQLEALGPPPHLTIKQFSTRVRWASTFGGVTVGETYGAAVRTLLGSLIRSPDYSPAAVLRTIRGITITQSKLLAELAALDLCSTVPRLDVPIVMAQGRHDQVAPGEWAQRYFDSIDAPGKNLVWFEHSAHTPHLEEPERFWELLMDVRGSITTRSSVHLHERTVS